MDLADSDPEIQILDTTLRDGSYAHDFQFTVGQTKSLCRDLEASGVNLIEIGHGIGLNASNSGYRDAVASDEEYMRAAAEACEDALWGMFCIPGVATLEDIELAAENGMDFIRIGTNINEVEKSKEFIELAEERGMFVTANYMKSYARPPEIFAEKVEQSESYGADMVYIVDSAGGMLPSTVEEYYEAVKDVSEIPVGFHGHDNLGLAVANSYRMAEKGAFVIDTSLQGLGRSAGNAGTEKTIAVLEKAGYDTGTDLLKLLRTGQRHVSPIRSNPAQMPLDIFAGQSEFHSSHLTKILDAAYEYDVDPALLIAEVCKEDKINAPESLVREAAQRIQESSEARVSDYGFSHYPGQEEDE